MTANPSASRDGDDLDLLLSVLPEDLRRAVQALPEAELLEVVLDVGRLPEARLTERAVKLGDEPVTREVLRHAVERLGPMGEDNRAGIERTLHRISAIRNRRGEVVGLTLRVGRAVFGTIDMLRDLVKSGRNILLLGRPGVGKTTKLREVARVLADEFGKRVMVVDTSNEIGGDGDVPHPGLGGARRMQVARPDRQHAVMIEAVENHMPEAIVVDEIGTEAEALAARTIAERGVQLVATAHGNTLENLVLNPTLSDLIGGVHQVTLSDEEAARRGTQKTVSERKAPPTFDVVVEIVERDEVVVHKDTAEAVDRLLAGEAPGGERRRQDGGKVVESRVDEPPPPPAAGDLLHDLPSSSTLRSGMVRIYGHALSPDLLERSLRDLPIRARIVARPDQADVIFALRARAGDVKLTRAVEQTGAPVWVCKHNSGSELRRVLKKAFFVEGGMEAEQVREAVLEAEHAIRRAMAEGIDVPLAPRPPGLRALQQRLVARYHLETVSHGSEPRRHLVVHAPARVHDEEQAQPADQ